MTIETDCTGCGQRLRVADEHAGKKARCPRCQTISPIPVGPAEALVDTSPSAVATAWPGNNLHASATEMWLLRVDDGSQYGPVSRSELDAWLEQGRVTPRSQLQNTRDGRWRPAGEIYAALGRSPEAEPRANPFRDPPVENPYAPPSDLLGQRPSTPWQEPHNGGAVLAIGILTVMLCALLGPVTVYLGHQSLASIRQGRMDPSGHGLVLAGTVLGWIGTGQLALVVLLFLLSAVIGMAG
jgi:phage FluMu protein Com